LLYHLRLQPSEVDRLSYWRYYYIVQNLTELLKKKSDAESEQSEGYNANKMQNPQAQLNKYTKGAPKLPGMSMPKFPSMPNIKL